MDLMFLHLISSLSFVFVLVDGFPSPQSGAHGQPQAGLPVPTTPLPVGLAMPTGGMGVGVGGVRRNWAGWREWRRADPTLINSLWRSKMGNGIRKQLGWFFSSSPANYVSQA